MKQMCLYNMLIAMHSGDDPMHCCWCNKERVFKYWYYENVMQLNLGRCLNQTTQHIYFAVKQFKQIHLKGFELSW